MGGKLPLNVFADLHNKNLRIFACKNRKILSQKREASMFAHHSRGSKSDFLDFKRL